MSKQIYVRPILPEESQMYFDWATESKINEFDSSVCLFPSSTTWAAFDESGPVAFQTLQAPIMLESLAPRPGLSPAQTAQALKELTQHAITLAYSRGAGEIYFLGTDADTDVFATSHIFQELPHKIFRAKLADLEGKNADNNQS